MDLESQFFSFPLKKVTSFKIYFYSSCQFTVDHIQQLEGKKGEIFKILPITRQLVHCSDGELDVWNKWDVIVGIL